MLIFLVAVTRRSHWRRLSSDSQFSTVRSTWWPEQEAAWSRCICGQEADSEQEGEQTMESPGPSLRGPLPLASLHLQKDLQPSQTASSAEDPVFTQPAWNLTSRQQWYVYRWLQGQWCGSVGKGTCHTSGIWVWFPGPTRGWKEVSVLWLPHAHVARVLTRLMEAILVHFKTVWDERWAVWEGHGKRWVVFQGELTSLQGQRGLVGTLCSSCLRPVKAVSPPLPLPDETAGRFSVSQDTVSSGALILGFSNCRTVRNNIVLFHSYPRNQSKPTGAGDLECIWFLPSSPGLEFTASIWSSVLVAWGLEFFSVVNKSSLKKLGPNLLQAPLAL